ncbi:hypothetical protein [Limimaricola sp.]|uniref:hypothetical protein n=1 Tax=Limimaricola sp. TaxID=2211665 RepID=UPI0040593874
MPGFETLLLPLGLGLLGFVEPCTVGAHLLFLRSQSDRPRAARIRALLPFILARVAVMAGFGAALALMGRALIGVQTGMWLVFGGLYLGLGLAIWTGRDTRLRRRIALAPDRWRGAASPAVQGAAFGLNIPACAAPLLFPLLALAGSGGSAARGALVMAVFATALSLPLAPFLLGGRSARLERLQAALRGRRRIIGALLAALGLWSIWFGLFVDPEAWSGL